MKVKLLWAVEFTTLPLKSHLVEEKTIFTILEIKNNLYDVYFIFSFLYYLFYATITMLLHLVFTEQFCEVCMTSEFSVQFIYLYTIYTLLQCVHFILLNRY